MSQLRKAMLCLLSALAILVSSRGLRGQDDPLPSWNNSKPKQKIVQFVEQTTTAGSPTFVEPAERIAVFDNDGTLWCEKPYYFQLEFMLEQVRAAVLKHPEWKNDAAYKAIVARDAKALEAIGMKPVLQLVAKANSGMLVSQYDKAIRDWLATARHPRFERPYTDLVYAPMQELLAYLRANGFRTYIVSGGSVEFMRPWAEKAYGIPPEQVIGTQQEVRYELKNGRPSLVRGPSFAFVNDGPGKPIGIYRSLGRLPIAAFGNSDGDLQMFQMTAAGQGPRLVLVIHHDDETREYAYDRGSRVGGLDKAWDEALEKGWIVVSMKNDWAKVFGFDK